MKIYVHSPRYFLRPRNTDWRYSQFSIPRLQEYLRDFEFVLSRSWKQSADANARYAMRAAAARLGQQNQQGGSYLDRDDFLRSGCDLVFSHEDFPRNATGIRVIWQNSILDPAMQRARGSTEDRLKAEEEWKVEGFQQAAAVQVSTEAERRRLGERFPEMAERFFAVPFFLPSLKAISEDEMLRKTERRGKLRCLFVGHEARRKGLDRVYAALRTMPARLQDEVELTVVSMQSDGEVPATGLKNVSVCRTVPHEEALRLMRESDVLLMPSRFESYGLVFLEAMAQGTIPMAPDWEVQREIVDGGRAGLLTSGNEAEIAAMLGRLVNEPEQRTGLAMRAWERFLAEYAPRVVAEKFGEMARCAMASQ